MTGQVSKKIYEELTDALSEIELQKIKIERLRAEVKQLKAAGLAVLNAGDVEVRELRVEIERLRALLQINNHHLAKLVNGTADEDPTTWEDAKNQVLATRAVLLAARDLKP